LRVSICHCLDCQRRAGSAFAAPARFTKDSVHISGASTAYVRVGEEGCRTTFHFCPHCSVIVYYQREADEDTPISIGAFADPGFPAPTRSVWEEDQRLWVVLTGNIEQLV
jgi:hypothetical protein